jgi:hypothetical protein
MAYDTDTLTVYKGRGKTLKQKWRWKYQAEGNNAKLGNGGEGYDSKAMCLTSAFRVCGIEATIQGVRVSPGEGVYPRTNGVSVRVVVSE